MRGSKNFKKESYHMKPKSTFLVGTLKGLHALPEKYLYSLVYHCYTQDITEMESAYLPINKRINNENVYTCIQNGVFIHL